jgi:hypothetical protein
MEIEGTTFSTNTARAGGGANFFGDAAILNSTFSGNIAAGFGGGGAISMSSIADGTDVQISHTTIAENQADPGQGAGIKFVGDTLTLGSSILENPDDGGDCSIFVSQINSTGYNVVSDASCMLTGGTGDLQSTDPMLGALGDNGAPAVAGIPGSEVVTQTHALLAGSPAIDRSRSGPPTDQRGVARPQGAFCDSGAFELEMAAAPSPSCAGPPPPPRGGGGSGGGGGAFVAQVPSNAFELGKLKRNKKKGIAFLIAEFPGPGQAGWEGKGVKEFGLAATAGARKSIAVQGGRVKLKIKPGKKGKRARKVRRALERKGKAKVKVLVTYVPTGGTANTQARRVKLVRK